MNFKIEKIEQEVNFVDSSTNEKFDYVKFAEKLYNGEKIKITNFGNLSSDEKIIVNQTIRELNDLSAPKKRKKIIMKYNEN